MARLLFASIVAVVTCACAAGDESSRTPITIDTPATVTGALDVSVEEGPVGDDDLSEINFGSVTTGEGVVLVAVPADVARASGVTRDELVSGGSYEVALVDVFATAGPDAPTYLVASLAAVAAGG
ncbi:hypothetical protein [Ilumatobacter sp.]|uniref:hypothetical protein n=1 Tax=Ilumatobacter sp. TaxID=1967498 RepID=UPI003AF84C16